jgi:predicted RNA-binding protein with PUA domain
MHYIHGQSILNNQYIIHLIQYEKTSDSYQIWIERDGEILLWKKFNRNMPISIEFNINF